MPAIRKRTPATAAAPSPTHERGSLLTYITTRCTPQEREHVRLKGGGPYLRELVQKDMARDAKKASAGK